MKTQTDSGRDQLLVERLRRGDRSAVGELYDRYSTMLFGLIHRIVRIDAIAEDVLQETFLKIWRSFDSFDESKGSLTTWLINVARSVSIDKVRSKAFRNSAKNQSLDNSVSLVDRQANTSIASDGIGIDGLLRQLRPEQQQIIDLIYYQGYTHDEAAQELSMPLGTVKTRLRAAIMQLRKDMAFTDETR
ncbi:MAG: sigma-70 family RNA polymerase sigma factor [bacterium]|nr:sigma-70 family RNA polymerase sigma factor [Candidatus Kapabacteria bacterium]